MSSKVVSAPVGTPVQVAFELMRDGGFRHLPVLSTKGKLMGILSDRDLRGVGAFFKDSNSGIDEFLVTEPTTVEKVMVADPITVSPDATISTAAKIIRDKRIGCLVVTEGDEMVGILSYLDVLESKDFICGTLVWCFADFRVPQHFGRQIYNRKGLFTRDRQPKLLAHLLKTRWAKPVRQRSTWKDPGMKKVYIKRSEEDWQ